MLATHVDCIPDTLAQEYNSPRTSTDDRLTDSMDRPVMAGSIGTFLLYRKFRDI